MNKTPLYELHNRMKRFRNRMETFDSEWECTVIFSKINMFYFTGTMQDGMLIIPRFSEAVLWVRRSYERAVDESLFSQIKFMESYRDAAAGSFTLNTKVVSSETLPKTVYLETEIVPIAMLQRFKKYFPFEDVKSVDAQISAIRAIKSSYELDIIKQSGQVHRRILETRVPDLLVEGMSEAELAGQLFSVMIEEGHHGVARFGMFDTEIGLGYICFGKSSIYPAYFNGPGGNYGMSPGVPILGSRECRLKKGDLVFIDIGCGVDGYHTDKTMTYMFGEQLPDKVIAEHLKCVDIQNDVASMLKPGVIPAQIYSKIMNGLSSEFKKNFMGFGTRSVKFLGHGIGLLIDEMPVIAEGFNEPLEEGMVFAIEPKKGIADIGMVGTENTFIVTSEGGCCITGDNPGMILV